MKISSRSELLVAGGRLFSHIGEPGTSIALFAAAAETLPGHPQYRLLLAEALVHFGRRVEAMQELSVLQQEEAPFWVRQRARNLREGLE